MMIRYEFVAVCFNCLSFDISSVFKLSISVLTVCNGNDS